MTESTESYSVRRARLRPEPVHSSDQVPVCTTFVFELCVIVGPEQETLTTQNCESLVRYSFGFVGVPLLDPDSWFYEDRLPGLVDGRHACSGRIVRVGGVSGSFRVHPQWSFYLTIKLTIKPYETMGRHLLVVCSKCRFEEFLNGRGRQSPGEGERGRRGI